MVDVRKRKSSDINGEQQCIREIVIGKKKRKPLDEEAILKKTKEEIQLNNRNEIDGGKKIDEKVEHKRATLKKRKQLEDDSETKIEKEERGFVSNRTEINQVAVIGKNIEEIAKKRKQETGEKEQGGIVVHLPDELWTENILARIPAQTLLARCNPVSKLWHNSIIKDARFAAVHNVLNRNKKRLILNLLNAFRGGIDNVYFFSLEAEKDDHLRPELINRIETQNISELVGYANGLACIKLVNKPDDAEGSIYVVNPVRFDTLALYYVNPTGGYIYLCHGFGFDSISQVYKAVIVFTSKDDDEFVCMVITLGTMSWRNIITSTLDISPPFPGRMVTRLSSSFYRPATYCGGDLLWRTTSEVGNDFKIEMLLSFDLHSEKIRFIPLPAVSTLTPTTDQHQYLVIDHLLEYKGYPCIARSEKTSISNSHHCGHRCEYQTDFNCCCCCKVHMYILKDKVKQVWIREETFDVQIKDPEGLLPAPLCCYFETSAVTPPTRMLTLYDQVLLYWFNGESLILYNLREKRLKVVKCSRSYPRIFQAKMNGTLGRGIGDDINIDCPYMDYQLHAQPENLVPMKTFIPEGAKTTDYDCIGDLEHAIKGNLPAGWVITGVKPFKCYAFCEDKVVGDKVSDDVVEGNPNESCSSKQSRSEKKSGRAMPKRPLIAKRSSKVQSTGSRFSQLMRKCENIIAISEKQKVTDNPIPEEEWMALLKGMPDLDENLELDAVDFLRGDSVDAQIFVTLSLELRKRWLIRKLRPNLL